MAVSLSALRTGRALLPRNNFSASGTHFCYRLSEPQGLGIGIGKLKKFIHFIRSRTRDLPACSIALDHYATVHTLKLAPQLVARNRRAYAKLDKNIISS
jgi:hypothetical protein